MNQKPITLKNVAAGLTIVPIGLLIVAIPICLLELILRSRN